jgi:hypothetical protein
MNALPDDSSAAELSAKINDLIVGLKSMLALLLVVISLPNILAALAIYHFDQIYQESLPGQTLPALTSFLLAHHQAIEVLSFLWPIGGLLLVTLGKRIRIWVLGGVLLILAVGLQFAVTEYAMITPLFDINPDALR